MFSDQPIKESNQDRFGRATFAKRIAQVISQREEAESIVIGLHAPWGEGKTSVLNMISQELKENENILIVNFNPWRFPDESTLLKHFFKFLAEKFDASLETKTEKISDFANKYAGALAPISLFGIDAKGAVESISKAVPEADLEKLKERIETVLKKSKKRIVVIMDDIDRLDKEEIQALFRLVKLSADFHNTAYILSFDVERVAEALAEKYGTGESAKEAGMAFLEKIVQVSLPLPLVTSQNLRKMAYEELDKLLSQHKIELGKSEAGTFGYEFQQAFDSKLENPRLVKRYINRLTFLFPILQNEVNLVDLMLIEGIFVFYPKLYKIIQDNPNLFLEGGLLGEVDFEFDFEKEKRKKNLIEEIAYFPAKEQENIKRIISKLFPKTSGVFSNTHYGRSWNKTWAKEKRIASPDYFLRYFNYGIPINDISDIELQDFLSKIDSQSKEENFHAIKTLISKDREDLFISKLRQVVDSLQESNAISLATVIAENGDIFTRKELNQTFFGQDAFQQAAILIRNCLEQIKELDKREKIAIELIQKATPLDFAGEYFRWNHNFKDNEGNVKEVFVSDICEQIILDNLVSRIKNEATKELLEKKYPLKSSRLYFDWLYKDRESFENYLKNRFTNYPEQAGEFVYSFFQQSYELRSIVSSLGFDFVIQAIKQSNPTIDTNNSTEYGDFDSIKSKEDFLRRFLIIYKNTKEN